MDLFQIQRSWQMGIYRCPASEEMPSSLSEDSMGFVPQQYFDGKTVYFASHDETVEAEENGFDGTGRHGNRSGGIPHLSNSGLWSLTPGGIYFVPDEAPRSLRYFDFVSRQIRTIFEVDNDLAAGFRSFPMAAGYSIH